MDNDLTPAQLGYLQELLSDAEFDLSQDREKAVHCTDMVRLNTDLRHVQAIRAWIRRRTD